MKLPSHQSYVPDEIDSLARRHAARLFIDERFLAQLVFPNGDSGPRHN
jgi:hypothetical protein